MILLQTICVVSAAFCFGIDYALPQDSKSASVFYYMGLGLITLGAVGSLL